MEKIQKNQQTVINKYVSKGIGHKINIEKSIVFLYTSNKIIRRWSF